MNRLNQERARTIGFVCEPTLTNNVDELHGDGVIGDLKDKFIKKFLDSRPRIINDLIKSEGKAIVERVEVCRSPIRSIFEKLLNTLSFGMLKRKMKERDYDKLFHLYVILYLSNGSVYRIEKNQRMNIIKNPKKNAETVCKTTAVGNSSLGSTRSENAHINFETFITAPERVDMKNLYRYNAFSENCQNYVKRLLNANGITQFDDFILQKVKDIAPPYLQKIARGITDIAGTIDYLYRGGAYDKKNMDDRIYDDILNGG